MADKPTAVDILSEAMEYLSKLGLKLRTRSDSMKEKKIKQNKLRNSHAVKKTANKVLLLCELSKKSLNIVESTVKNILSAVGSEQADSDGGKSRRHSSTDGDKKAHYFYFDYRSRKLKMAQRVSIKHFTSVKVLAKKMPLAMMKNYPVYYDCKLLRARKAKEVRSKTSPDKESIRSPTESSHSTAEENNDVQKLSDEDDVLFPKKKCVNNKRILETDSEDEDTNKISMSLENKTSSNKSGVLSINKRDSEKVSKSVSNKENETENEFDNLKTSRSQTTLAESESIEEDENQKDITETTQLIEILSVCTNANQNSVTEGSSTIENSNEASNKVDMKSLEESKKNCPKSIKPSVEPEDDNVVITLDDNDESLSKTSVNSNKDCSKSNENSDSDSKTKPLIKCVHLSKLLKSTVLQKVGLQIVESSRKENCKNRTGLQGPNRENTKKTPKRVKYTDEEDYWSPIRKQVAAFKPKKFTINISRLPEWSNTFLNKNNINKITQNGKVIYERAELPDEISENVINKQIDMIHSPKNTEPDILNVKKALLIDSESEISDTNETQSKSPKNSKSNKKSCEEERSKDSNEKKSQDMNEDKSSQSSKEKVKNSCKEKSGSLNKNNEANSYHREEEKLKHNDQEKAISSNEDKAKSSDEERSKNSYGEKANSSNEENLKSSDEEKSKSYDEELSKCRSKKSKHNYDDKSESCDEEQSKNKQFKHSDKDVTIDMVPSQSSSKEPENKEKTAEKTIDNDTNKNDSCLIISSTEKSKNVEDTPTKSKRKHIMESMKAKKMLLTYSSSDTEDEKLNEVLKEIKGSLLKEGSSDEDKITEPKKKSSSSESEEVKKPKKKYMDSTSSEDSKPKAKKSKSSEKKKNYKKMGRTTDKAGGSSSQNSDTQDEKDIDGLTNIKSLTKSRLRRESSPTAEKSTRSSSRKKMSVPPLITGEGLLEAPDSTDNSDPESDTVEELPPISLTGLNGGGEGLTHLAKDDLLGESDSSSSNENDKDDQEIKDESEDDDNVKSKRRKANTISSSSEGESKSKKNADKHVSDKKVSDFEDSEDESSEPAKRKRKKKQANDSDDSDSGSDGGKKKRRRIKQINDSDASGSDSENEGRKHGRKNIRKVMGKNQLEEATKKAARREKERIARIAERQKIYNNLEFDETGKPDEVIPDKLVLDFDLETKEPIVEVDKGLVRKLKPHQANGIRFMWDACFESVKRIKKDRGSGCILAHCMGLGKTLQVVALTHTLLTHNSLTGVNRVLVVCPLSTVLNWVNEFQMWLKNAQKEKEVDIYELSRFKQNSERAFQLTQWLTHGGVCVLGYEMFRNLSAENPKKYKKKMLKNFQEALVDPGPDLVVCDEGHLLKNEKTSLSQSMNKVRTLRRIVLTGTPLQNNLKEYYCMVQFVKPNLLGKYNEYLNRFVNPITNGQYTDSTEYDIKVMKRRSHVLHKMLDGAVQRRDYSVLAPFLPPKHEYVLFITLSEVQIKLYQNYLDNYSRRPLPGKSSGFLFPDFQSLQRIWTHPLVLKYNSERYEIMQQKKRDREEEDSEGSLVDFIDDDSTPEESSTEESSDDLSDLSDDSRKKSKKKKSAKKSKGKSSIRRGTRANPVELNDDEDLNNSDVIEVKNENPTEWWIPLVTDEELEDIRFSPKLMLLFDILRQCEAIGDKLLVFSQSLYSLDLIEHFLGKVDEATQEGRIDEKLGGHVGSWSPGLDYFRLDGSTSCENRSIWCKNFNREGNPRARLFLISTRAGGLGINLVAANRVIIFDVSWNPSHDVQSIFRVYRFGQKKPCYIYRFLAMGTMEEKIYERQVTKQAISKRVIDEQQIDRHYAENDLAELYKFEPRPPVPRPVPPVPKDRMFAELLKNHDALVYKFHEHDSLLENKEEETLSEEERKAAWEDFENEKNRPPPSPYPTAWPMNNGMVNNLLAQQQQQLAYAALATMLRKDMPNISDDQLRNMLPLIYGANPGLMQKLGDLYKYPGAGMMNPILNSVMNSGSGAGAAMGGGGTSGLQYEPPWARDQQQQQQIRLQQIMQQQQNSLGAKMYAGGLGSRDPVAMALQQQRAREMMMQQAAGRQRGRPPHTPNQPRPHTTTDVVTLDSD